MHTHAHILNVNDKKRNQPLKHTFNTQKVIKVVKWSLLDSSLPSPFLLDNLLHRNLSCMAALIIHHTQVNSRLKDSEITRWREDDHFWRCRLFSSINTCVFLSNVFSCYCICISPPHPSLPNPGVLEIEHWPLQVLGRYTLSRSYSTFSLFWKMFKVTGKL